MSGASHCREVLTVRSFSPSGGLNVGSVRVLFLLWKCISVACVTRCYLNQKLVTVRSSGYCELLRMGPTQELFIIV